MSEEKALTVDEIYERFVANAFGYLNQTLKDLENRPRFAIIAFFSAVELILKARLLNEHWTLLISPQKPCSWEQFNSGDFESVSFEESIDRLKNVIGFSLSREQFLNFDRIRKHRNKYLHFFHLDHCKADNSYQKPPLSAGDLSSLMDLYNGWVSLIQLMNNLSMKLPSAVRSKVPSLEKELSKFQPYFANVFNEHRYEIERLKKEGGTVYECRHCKYESSIEVFRVDCSVFTSSVVSCLVCKRNSQEIHAFCPDCSNELQIFSTSDAVKCKSCDKGVWDSFDRFVENLEGFHGDQTGEKSVMYCGECHSSEVIAISEDCFFCKMCYEKKDKVVNCEYCNSRITGELEDSYLQGCGQCEGSLARFMGRE